MNVKYNRWKIKLRKSINHWKYYLSSDLSAYTPSNHSNALPCKWKTYCRHIQYLCCRAMSWLCSRLTFSFTAFCHHVYVIWSTLQGSCSTTRDALGLSGILCCYFHCQHKKLLFKVVFKSRLQWVLHYFWELKNAGVYNCYLKNALNRFQLMHTTTTHRITENAHK